jgi:hypothetical protein
MGVYPLAYVRLSLCFAIHKCTNRDIKVNDSETLDCVIVVRSPWRSLPSVGPFLNERTGLNQQCAQGHTKNFYPCVLEARIISPESPFGGAE